MHQTNPLRQLSAFLLFCTIVTACSKPNEEEKQNKPPSSFTVSVSNVTFNSAIINWTASSDPENEAVTYSVDLNGQLVASNISATTQTLNSLQKNTAYSGKVTAKDAAGNSTAVSFTFNTSDSPPPSDFTLKVDASTNKSLTISWTASTLPTNEAVVYDVYVNNILKLTNQASTQCILTGLTPKTNYQVKVVAKSPGGKSTEKVLSSQTTDNTAPATFAAEEVIYGFSYVTLKWAVASDSDNDSLSYFLNANGVITPLTETPLNGFYNYTVKGLPSSATHTFRIIAKDAFGGETSSNDVRVTTNQAPENNFQFTAKNEGSNVAIEWILTYPIPFNALASSYFINGVEKTLNTMPVSIIDLGSGKFAVKVLLNSSDFPENASCDVKLKLNWGINEKSTQSQTITHTRYSFTATTAEVASAVIKKYSNGDYGFVLTFKNDIISDYTTWSVKEVRFDNSIRPGTISLQFPSGKTVHSVFGNLSEIDFNYLKTKSEGFIILQDAGGYHRLNFTYSVQ